MNTTNCNKTLKRNLEGVSVLLDRDGTIIEDRHYLSDPSDVALLPGVPKALALLHGLGAKLFIVTNQSGIGRGYFDLAAYKRCEAELDSQLAAHGVRVEHTVFCPHAPEEICTCRKPATGLWQELASSFDLREACSVMIGDKMADFEFGLNCNLAASILVLSGKGRSEAEKFGLPLPDKNAALLLASKASETCTAPKVVASDLLSAAKWIVENFNPPAPMC